MQSRTRQRLDELRLKLLRLHKVLLDDEKAAYERIFGPVGGPGKLLGLVMSDPFFDWLHQISRLIVRIDETSENKEATDEMGSACISDAVSLLTSDKDSDFTRRYKKALERNVHAKAAQAAVLQAVHDD